MQIIKSIENRKFRSTKSITADRQVAQLNAFVDTFLSAAMCQIGRIPSDDRSRDQGEGISPPPRLAYPTN